jgi:hypothetical protein
MARALGTLALGGGNAVKTIGRDAAKARGTREMTRLRFLPVTGVLVAMILALTGCCAGYCSHSAPPIGAGVQHSSQQAARR